MMSAGGGFGGNRRSHETLLECLHSGVAPGKGPGQGAGPGSGMPHIASILANISGVAAAGLDVGKGLHGPNSEGTPPLRPSNSLHESPERDDQKGVVLRQTRERKGDKRNSAGNRLSCPPGSLSKLSSQMFASESDLSSIGALSPKRGSTVQRFSFMFSTSKPLVRQEKLDRFNEVLNGLNTGNATPRVCEKESRQSYVDFCEEGHSLCLEETWQKVVKNFELLSKKESAQQSAVWELLSTEINYMRILKSVIDVYAKNLAMLQKREENFLSEISFSNLFSNIEDVYNANHSLWVSHMLQVLEFSRKTGNTLNPSLLKDTFKEMPEIFKPYVEFCKAADACQRYLQHQKENNQMFAAYLQWADNQILNDLRVREGLKAHLTKPMQRLTRYKVILMRIRDETVDEQVRCELQEMVDVVDSFVTKVNNEVALKQKKEKLHEMHKKLGPYDCVETPGEEYAVFASNYSGFRVKNPMKHNQEPREILMEGHLKMKEGQTRWTEVYCILFTDLFLICKTSKRSHADRLRVIKPPMRLDMIRLHMVPTPSPSLALAHLTEFECLSNLYAFTEDSQKLEQWFSKFNEAYRCYKEAVAVAAADDPFGAASRYTRTFSVQSEQFEKDNRRRSNTFGSASLGSAPSLTGSLSEPRPPPSAGAFSPQHLSRSPLRRCPIEASPLSRETSVTSSAPSVTSSVPSFEGSTRRLPRTPLFSLSSVDDSPFAKKRFSLGNQGSSGPTGAQQNSNDPAVVVTERGTADGHSPSLESFRSSSGVSSVDSAHAYSGSELSNASLRATATPTMPVCVGGLQSSSSTINDSEKRIRYASVGSCSSSEEEEEEDPQNEAFVDHLAASSIRVVDKRFSRSLNDLSLHSLAIAPANPPPLDIERRLSSQKTGMSPEDLKILLIEGSDAEATSV